MREFIYTENDFVYSTSWEEPVNLSKFDRDVNKYWNQALENGYFRSQTIIYSRKQLEGKHGFIAQFNPERGSKRRKPQVIQTMDDPFEPASFNFTTIPDREVIFRMIETQQGELWTNSPINLLTINVSPLAASHCLILPEVDQKLPQILSFYAAKLAVHTLLLSSNPSFRVGFNSLCGFASVNHLHLHTFLLPQKMLLETLTLKQLAGSCYEVDHYAVKGFAFERKLRCSEDIESLARDTYKLANFFQQRKIAHNINFTRSDDSCEDPKRSKVRVYLWAREYSLVKVTTAFSPALCEFFGLLDFKTQSDFEAATEESICSILEKHTKRPFEEVRESVRELFATPDDSVKPLPKLTTG